MICICEIPDSPVLPEDLLSRLPRWRLQKALSYRSDLDRFLCAKSFLMLEDMLLKQFGLPRCPEFSCGQNGKPFLKEYPAVHFNISHCHRGIVCAVCDSPVGVDIEVIQFDKDVAEGAFNAEERDMIEMSGEPDVRFTELWTRKESYLKLTGEGIKAGLKDILSNVGNVRFRTECNRDAGYVFSVAAYEESPLSAPPVYDHL